MITAIAEWLQNLIVTIGPIGLAIATCVESFFAPIPSEIILLTAGTVTESYPEVLLYALFASIGSYIGTLPFYFIGHKSRDFVFSFFSKYGVYFFITTDDIEMAESKFEKYGTPIIFFGRLIPIIRSLISIPAGITRMDLKRYSIYTLAGSLLWNLLLISCGFYSQGALEQILIILDDYEKLVLALGVVAVIVYIIIGYRRNKK